VNRLVLVELTALERVVLRGTERVTWWVHTEGRWCPVRKLPEVQLEARSTGPQVVWETRARLQLEPGTWLLRLTRSPHPQPARDPMQYLDREALRPRAKLTRHYFRVGVRGELRKPARDQTPPDLEDERERIEGD
jgi:hypothetical protein